MDIQAYIQSGVIESYVLGVATDEERLEVEQLLGQYPEVREAIDDFSLSLERYSRAQAVSPPAAVKNNILKELSSDFRTSTTKAQNLSVAVNNAKEKEPLTPPSRYKVWRFVAAASIILLIVSSAINIYLFKRYSDTSYQYQALLQERNTLIADNGAIQARLQRWDSAGRLIANPGVSIVKMPGVPGKENIATAMVFWDKNSRAVYVMANKLPAPAKGRQYQLWAMVNGQPVDAGMLSNDCKEICKMDKYIPNAQAFAITLEKEGGSPTPTMDQLFVLGKI